MVGNKEIFSVLMYGMTGSCVGRERVSGSLSARDRLASDAHVGSRSLSMSLAHNTVPPHNYNDSMLDIFRTELRYGLFWRGRSDLSGGYIENSRA